MELQCKIAVNAAKETIWPYYADSAKWPVWEEDLENLNTSYCDKTDVPGMGSLFFEHKILHEDGQTYIQHSVRLEKDALTEEDLGFLSGVFADVPGAMLKIKRQAEK